jgi:hypothetical protein
MLGERKITAPLMAQCTAHGALSLAHRRFQPGPGIGIQFAGLGLGGEPQRPSQCQLGHQTLVLALALFAPAAPRPGQDRAVRRQRRRQTAPYGHVSTVEQRFLRPVVGNDRQQPGWRVTRIRTSWARTGLFRYPHDLVPGGTSPSRPASPRGTHRPAAPPHDPATGRPRGPATRSPLLPGGPDRQVHVDNRSIGKTPGLNEIHS